MKQCDKGHFYDDIRFDSCPYCKDGTGLGKQAVAAFQNQQFPAFQPAPVQPVMSAPAPANSGFKFCTKCGTRADSGAKFCTGCGNPFPVPVQTPAADIGRTVAVQSAPVSPTSDIGKTVAVKPMTIVPSSDIGKTVAVSPMVPKTPTSDIGKTVALQPMVEIPAAPSSDIGKTVSGNTPEQAPAKKSEKPRPVAFMVCISGENTGDTFTVAEGRNYIASGPDADIRLDKDSSVSAECHSVVTYNPSENKFTLSAGTSRGITYLNGNQVDLFSELNAYDKIKAGNSELLFVPVCSDKFKWDALS